MPASVLIVDDVELNVLMLRGMAEHLGDCEALCFTSAPARSHGVSTVRRI
ncbi:MAG TPA: hypothetical protein VFQ57_08340 [Sphingomonas sp.]|jgi:hypothetical protein|nr:hypothetical protein [Sphingomonas sp.]